MKYIIPLLALLIWSWTGISELLINKKKEIKISKWEFFLLWIVVLAIIIGWFNK
jgi:hypothetical protein